MALPAVMATPFDMFGAPYVHNKESAGVSYTLSLLFSPLLKYF